MSKPLARHLILLIAALALVAVSPISTDISNQHFLLMGLPLALAVALPYLMSRFAYRDNVISFPFRAGRHWYRREFAYIGLTALIGYLVLPFYFRTTGAYLNWPRPAGTADLVKLFVGTQLLGLWDELFFCNTVLPLLRAHLRFLYANLLQAAFWTVFLYQLGFRGWIPPLIFLFACLQGYIYVRTRSLLYIITIHLTLDAVLYLALLHAYYPAWPSIFAW